MVAQSVERPFKGLSKRCNSLTWVQIPAGAQGGRKKVLVATSMGKHGNKHKLWEKVEQFFYLSELNSGAPLCGTFLRMQY